jgi:hypothetical protein
MASPSHGKKSSGSLFSLRNAFRMIGHRPASKAPSTSQNQPELILSPPNDPPSTSAPIPPAPLPITTAERLPAPAPHLIDPTACRVPAKNTDEYAAIGGVPLPDTLPPGQRMKERGKTVYQGLIAVVQALSDCSDIFLPLKTTCNVILTIHKTIDVRSMHLFYI